MSNLQKLFQNIPTNEPGDGMAEVRPKRKPPLYLNLSDFKLLVAIMDETTLVDATEIELKVKIQTIISYIERARLRSRGDSQ